MPDFLLPVQYLRQIAEQLRVMGVAPAEWLGHCGVGLEQLDDPHYQPRVELFGELIQQALRLSEQPALGLLIGERLGVGTHGALGFAALQGGSLRQVVELLERYLAVRITLVRVQLEQDEATQQEHLRFVATHPLGAIEQTVIEAVMLAVKNIFDACIAAIMWYAVGSSLAGGNGDDFTSTGENGFAGSGGFFRTVSTANKSAYAKAGWFFGWTFAGAGCTIVSGAIAERATFLAYALYSVILTGFVYPPVVHMMWGAGKFSAWRSGPRLFGDCGVIDFAGSGTVHMTGGVAAIIAAGCIGVRKGFPDALPEGQPVYQALGILILWMGWYGFNCVSTCVEIKILRRVPAIDATPAR